MTCASSQKRCNSPEWEHVGSSTSDGRATDGCLASEYLTSPRNVRSKDHISKAFLAPDTSKDSLEVILDDQEDTDDFWKSLNHTIEQILMEVDRMIPLGSKPQRHITTQHHPAGGGAQVQVAEHKESSVMLECDDGPRQANVLRRPQAVDEYWSISTAAWSRLSRARQIVLSHVGRINETSEGEQALHGDCKKCSESGAECMVYRGPVGRGSRTDCGSSCSRCRFRGLACSLASAGRLREKKKKHRAVMFKGP